MSSLLQQLQNTQKQLKNNSKTDHKNIGFLYYFLYLYKQINVNNFVIYVPHKYN